MGEVSMKEIARRAGVSVATVSRAFQIPQQVNPETREKVLRVAKNLGYIYNAAARDFSSKRSTVIGVLAPKISNSLFGSSIVNIQDTATEKGFSVILGCTKYDVDEERRLLHQFQERRISGLILTGFTNKNEHLVQELVDAGLACVVVWEKLESTKISYVGFDNRKAAYMATKYLIDLGHERIGLIIGPYSVVSRVNKRLEGYEKALTDHGLSVDPALIVERMPTLFEGKASTEYLLSRKNPPTAIFAASDFLAIGAMQAIHERGLSIPKDISIVGFDDIEMAAYTYPPLTSVRVDAERIGRLAAEILIDMAAGKTGDPRQYCLDTDIIIRGSCAPAPRK